MLRILYSLLLHFTQNYRREQQLRLINDFQQFRFKFLNETTK